jgi:hypothetical protein
MAKNLFKSIPNPYVNSPLSGDSGTDMVAPGLPQFVVTDDNLYGITDDGLFVTTDN